jgi:hypothetical protein
MTCHIRLCSSPSGFAYGVDTSLKIWGKRVSRRKNHSHPRLNAIIKPAPSKPEQPAAIITAKRALSMVRWARSRTRSDRKGWSRNFVRPKVASVAGLQKELFHADRREGQKRHASTEAMPAAIQTRPVPRSRSRQKRGREKHERRQHRRDHTGAVPTCQQKRLPRADAAQRNKR